jgi:DNA-binding NarL/FixJ family response regulator
MQVKAATTVAVVAGTRLYRDGIAQALANDERLAVVAVLEGSRDDLDCLAAAKPDVLVLDIASLADFGSLYSIRRVVPRTRVIVLGASEREDLIIGCAEAGVAGFVEGEAGVAELTDVVHAAMRGEVVCSPRVAAALLRRIGAIGSPRQETPGAIERLTRRELQILDLIGDGLSNKEIAQSLHIELGTVKAHVHSLLDKLDVHRRAQAVARRRELEASHVFATPLTRRGAARSSSKVAAKI